MRGKWSSRSSFPAHWAPNDLLFYDGEQYPARCRGRLRGVSRLLEPPLEQAGYQVAFAPRAGGEFTGRYETFAAGFAVTSPMLSP